MFISYILSKYDGWTLNFKWTFLRLLPNRLSTVPIRITSPVSYRPLDPCTFGIFHISILLFSLICPWRIHHECHRMHYKYQLIIYISVSVPQDDCFAKYECLEDWYQPSKKLLATIYRVNTLRDCAAECCKNDKCVAHEWIRNSRYCYLMNSEWEYSTLAPYNQRIICQLKQGNLHLNTNL